MGAKIAKKNVLPNVSWSALGSIGRSPAVRLTILIPVLGYMLLLNYEFLKLVQLVSTNTWTTDGAPLDPPLKLIFTYLGLCCLGLASTIFVLRCPDGPKTYSSEGVFATSMNEVGDPGVEFLQFNYICHRIGKAQKQRILPNEDMIALIRTLSTLESIAEWMVMHRGRPSGFSAKELIEEVVAEKGMPFKFMTEIKPSLANERIGLAGAWFAMKDWERPKSRRAVWTLYSVGFLFLAIPTVWTVVEVLSQIARTTFDIF